MSSPETQFRADVVVWLSSMGAFPVENSAHPGTSDVIWPPNGCAELKVVTDEMWPKKEKTPVKLHRYTQAQRDFLADWQRHGGESWVIIRTPRFILCYNKIHQFEKLGLLPAKPLIESATACIVRHRAGIGVELESIIRHVC